MTDNRSIWIGFVTGKTAMNNTLWFSFRVYGANIFAAIEAAKALMANHGVDSDTIDVKSVMQQDSAHPRKGDTVILDETKGSE